jgi:hypothetical protein
MTTRIHLSIMQPAGYIHSQGFLDQARYARYQFRRLGAEVTIGKNRLREDSINIIFGAHLGFDAELRQRYTCVFFNLEQLGEGGARVSQDYMNLLRSSAVIDYDERNLAAYGCQAGDIPVVSFQYAPYLATTPALPLQDRPIDLLFFGSINERRKAIFSRIEACGWSVSMFDHPLYGEERDQFIRQAKAVFNCHFYESSRFEQARAFHTLSLGTPVISERTERTTPPPAFEDAVSWVSDDQLEDFFQNEFMTPAWQERAQGQLQRFSGTDPQGQWQVAHGYCQALWSTIGFERSEKVWLPTAMNLGSGKDYKLGWLNVDILERAQPDLVVDLGQKISLPIHSPTMGGGKVFLEEDSLEKIYANNVLEHVPDLPQLMSNLLTLLMEDGILEVEVPYEKAETAWQDPTHLRAMNKNSWLYYTSWFWYIGWFTHRFEVSQFIWLDHNLATCNESQAAFMRVRLTKVSTTLHERSVARTMRPDFGGVESDPFDIAPQHFSQALPANTNTNKIISIARLSFSEETTAVDHAWLQLLPQANSILALGLEASRLKNAYLSKFPDATWANHEGDWAYEEASVQAFDLLLIGTDAAASPILAANLEKIDPHLLPEARIIVALKNASSQQIIDYLIDCDTTDNCLQSSILTDRETPAHLYKILLDAGWSPSVKGQQTNPLLQQRPKQDIQVERARDLISMLDRLYIEAHRAPHSLKKKSGDALFTVVVPSTQQRQLKSNVMASSGLKEVRATVVSIQGAHSPADAIIEAMRHIDTEWILLAHQDVYLPRGFGEQLNAILSAIPDREKKTALLGFAGMGQSESHGHHAPAGHLTDRLYRFEHAHSNKAVSLDEFAIIMHKDSVHKIDPELGWHLWATDLCLSSIKRYDVYPRIVCLPIFHNSRTGWKLPEDFGKSAEILLKKHREFPTIYTLCGTLDAAVKASKLAV